MRVAFNVAGAFAVSACASIHAVESTTDTPLVPLIDHKIEEASLEYEVVSSTVTGYQLTVVIEQSETCAAVTTPRVHRHRHVDRRADPTATRATWALALTGLAAGVYGYVDADNLAARAADGTTPDQFRRYAGGTLAIGAVAAVIGVIDAVRAGDSELDDGVIESRPARESFACRRHRTRNTEVSLALANDHRIRARTDERGVATFSFLDVPEDGLSTLATTVAVVVDERHAPLVALEPPQIRARLLAEPRSRLAMQVLERHRGACTRAVGTARDAARAEPADVSARTPWLAAKSTCTDLWTPQLEAELVAVEGRIVDAECRSRLERAAAAFVDDAGTTVGELTDELAALHEMCTAPESVTSLRKLDAKLAASLWRLERQAAADARREAREQARAKAAYREAVERDSRSWPTSPQRTCCKFCSTGKACGNSCIARWKTCHKGVGCACDE